MEKMFLEGLIVSLITAYCMWALYCEHRVVKEICTRSKRKHSTGADDEPIHPKVYFYLFWGGPLTWLLTLFLYKFLCIFNKTRKG